VDSVTAKKDKDALVLKYADGAPAIVHRASGKGNTYYWTFLPGLTYFQPAIPRAPVDRGSSDSAMAHFIPIQFNKVIGRLLSTQVEGVARPVECSDPLVEANVVESKSGTAIMLTNWSAEPTIKGLRVKVNIPAPRKAALASGLPVKMEKEGSNAVYVLDLHLADALILR
jgi:hypothetical protein